MRRRWLSLIVLAATLVACNALTGIGDLAIEDALVDASFETFEASVATSSSSGAAPVVEAGTDGGGLGKIDAAVVDGCSSASCEELPTNFQLVALGSPSSSCPTGFGSPFDAVEAPTLDPGACSCGCDVTQNPTCTLASGNTIELRYSAPGSGTCASTGQDVPSGCSTDGFLGPFIEYDRSYIAPLATLSGGTCGVKTVKDETKLKTQSVRVCQATVLPQCEGKTCPPALDTFDTCVAAAGEVACPAGWPSRHIVGASASFTCGSGCSCTVAGQCSTTGTLSYFASSNCTGTAGLSYPVGGCNTTPGSTGAYGSHRYDPKPPTNVACKSTGTSAPSASLAQTSTVCCR